MQLIGREREKGRLEAFWSSDSFDIAIVYGRRRIGKSFLLCHFAKERRAIFFQATADKSANLRELGNLVSALTGSSYIVYPDYHAAFFEIGRIAMEEKLLFVIDELSFLFQSDNSVLSLLQKFVDHDYQHTCLKLILCSSYTSFMEERVISGTSPLFGRTSLRLKLLAMSPEESARFFPNWSLRDISYAHVIAGGVPYYLKRISGYASIEEALLNEFFTLGGALLSEPILLLYAWARNIQSYFLLMNALASGVTSTSKIADRLHIDPAQASAMLRTLNTFEIVCKKENAVIGGKKAPWQISDSFFAFWASYVFPAMTNIEIDNAKAAYNKTIAELPQFTGRHIEEDIRRYIIKSCGKIIREYGSAEFANQLERKNEELDFIARCDDGTYLFGEFKWRDREIGTSVLDDLRRKAVLALPSTVKREYYLCSEHGFSVELEQLSQAESQIHLITGGEIFGLH